MAAFSQVWRNALQSKLSTHQIRTEGVTLARFIIAIPIAGIYLWFLYLSGSTISLPNFNNTKLLQFATGAGIMQIMGTAFMVKLFKLKNYAVGAGLAKSEAIIAAILGVSFYSTTLNTLGWLGVFIGTIAVFLLSELGKWKHLDLKTIALGLASGTSFSLTSLWVRQACLCINIPFPHGAGWVLLMVTIFQTFILSCYIALTHPRTLVKLLQYKTLTFWIGITSCIGSIGWFSAMSLEKVAYVKTLGQIEVFFMIFISNYYLKQKIKNKNILGLLLIAVAAILVTLDKN